MSSVVRLLSADPATTQAIGAVVAAWLEPGDVVALSGDLGAGKTCLVQGAARGLGVAERVTSPTFVLSRHYRARLDVVHVDVYRLDRVRDVDQLGDDVFAPDVVTFVEWADAVRGVLPDDRLDVDLAFADEVGLPGHAATDDGAPPARVLRFTPRGRVVERMDALAAQLRAAAPDAEA